MSCLALSDPTTDKSGTLLFFGRNGSAVLNAKWLTSGSKDPTAEWNDTLLLAGSPAAVQVQRKGIKGHCPLSG